MSFADLPEETKAAQIFQASLKRQRLAHAYLITCGEIRAAETFARQIAKTLNCEEGEDTGPDRPPIDSCDTCVTCRQIDAHQQADVTWIRPESKSRIITIAQIRSVLETVHLKAHGARYKIFIVVAAERMNTQAANAFLKTLEEPPPRSVIFLLSGDPQRLLDTILSRCLRISLHQAGHFSREASGMNWLQRLCQRCGPSQASTNSRYQILGDLLACLATSRGQIETTLSADSPLETHDDLEPKLKERYKQELNAAIEAEYRRQRAEWVTLLQWFLRDIWLQSLQSGQSLLQFPDLASDTAAIAERITPESALENITIADTLQRQLNTNVQEALAIEVALLKMAL